MKTSNEMTEAESFNVIHQMISQAKQHYSDDSFLYLLWGWLVFAASLGHYALAASGFNAPYITWLLMPLGAIITIIYSKSKGKQQTVKTYLDDFMKYLVIAFVVSLLIVLFFMNKLQLNCYPMVMLVYGIWLFVSGGLLSFRPLMAGGFVNWALAIAAFYADFNTQLLLLAVAVLAGYIIPGYMLRMRYKKTAAI
jgi:hypothetical protein